MARLEPQHALESRDRFIDPTVAHQQHAEVSKRDGRIRIHAQGFAILVLCFLRQAALVENRPEH